MSDPACDRIRLSPEFTEIAERRSRLALMLFGITMIMYFSLVFTATFNPKLLATPMSPGAVTSVGWLIGAAVVIIPWLFTILYVWRANADSRAMSHIVKESFA